MGDSKQCHDGEVEKAEASGGHSATASGRSCPLTGFDNATWGGALVAAAVEASLWSPAEERSTHICGLFTKQLGTREKKAVEEVCSYQCGDSGNVWEICFLPRDRVLRRQLLGACTKQAR